METIKRMWARVRRLNPFGIVETFLTIAALVLVAATVGSQLGQKLGLHGDLATIAAWSIALVYDALWIGSLRMSEVAIRLRSAVGMAVFFSLTAIAIAASTYTLWKLGHAQVFAGVPAAAALFMGLRLFAGNVLADPTTAAEIAERSAEDRNARALAASHARHLESEAHTEVLAETAEHRAELRRQIARAEVLTKAQAEIDAARAKAEATLEAADKKHGTKAAAFMKRELLSVGSRPMVTADGHTSPELGGHAVVTQVIPEIEGVTTQLVTPDESDADLDVQQVPVEGAMTLEELAQAAGVETPKKSMHLSDGQLEVVLRWLRYTMEPPRSYRQAQDAFRKAGFQSREGRIRRIWGEIETREAEAVPA
jgi:hypothetical protein